MMRSLPIDSSALLASLEFAVQFAHSLGHESQNVVLRSVLEQAITGHASRERLNAPRQIKSPDDLSGLLAAVGFSQPVAVCDGRMLQQAAIACEQNQALLARNAHQLRICEATPVQRIESQHPQIGGKLPQMHIQNKFRVAERFLSHAQLGRDIDGFEHRIYADPIAIPDQIFGARRLAVGNDQLDFRVGHAETFNHVHHCAGDVEALFQRFVLLDGRQMIVQLRVEAEVSAVNGRVHNFMLALAAQTSNNIAPLLDSRGSVQSGDEQNRGAVPIGTE